MDIEALRATVVEFVRHNQVWAPVIVFALAFGESLAVVSLFVPATVLMLAIGALIGVAGIEFWPVWLGAAVGATLGDWVSYEIGRALKYRAFTIWPLSTRPDLVTMGENFFSRWGTWGIFIGRFFGPARAVVPLIAGIFAMPRILFQAANVASAMVWGFVLLAPGAGLQFLAL
ncbi:MAG TPA: DedA family protein [Beijerinckiaceae bacterium]|nr:DedA family protein [Beijerinckiaceae bacterium]